jgi:hypothetical protein
MQDEEMSLTDAGILAGLDSSTIRRHMMRGDLGKPRRGNRQWYVSRRSVEAYLQRAQQPVETPQAACGV